MSQDRLLCVSQSRLLCHRTGYSLCHRTGYSLCHRTGYSFLSQRKNRGINTDLRTGYTVCKKKKHKKECRLKDRLQQCANTAVPVGNHYCGCEHRLGGSWAVKVNNLSGHLDRLVGGNLSMNDQTCKPFNHK